MNDHTTLDLEYNTQRSHLALPEYGRHFQKLVKEIRTISDPEEKRAYIEETINIMVQLFPLVKTMDNWHEKIWHDIFYMADFDLDILPPSGIKPTMEDQFMKPQNLDYPKNNPFFRHYGSNVQLMIDKALKMDPGPFRDEYAAVIGSYMKLAFRTWNKEHFVSDEVIIQDLATMSRGILNIDAETDIDSLSANSSKKRYGSGIPQNSNLKNQKKRTNNNNNNNNRKRFKRRD